MRTFAPCARSGITAIPGIAIRQNGTGIDTDKPRFILDSNVLIDSLNKVLDLEAVLDELPDCEIYINGL